MDRGARTDAKRSRALAVVVAFVAVLFALSQLAPKRDASARSATSPPGAVERLQDDILRIRAAAAPIQHSTIAGSPRVLAETARFVDDVDAPGLPVRVRARMLDDATESVVRVCGECVEILQAARPEETAASVNPQHRGLWARKMIGLAP
jgi:hypothetical protein